MCKHTVVLQAVTTEIRLMGWIVRDVLEESIVIVSVQRVASPLCSGRPRLDFSPVPINHHPESPRSGERRIRVDASR